MTGNSAALRPFPVMVKQAQDIWNMSEIAIIVCLYRLGGLIVKIVLDCQWSPWSQWRPCSQSCQGGQQLRTRIVTRKQVGDGQTCEGGPEQSRGCNKWQCPGEWYYTGTTEPKINTCMWLWEDCWGVEGKVMSYSRTKHPKTYKYYFRDQHVVIHGSLYR